MRYSLIVLRKIKIKCLTFFPGIRSTERILNLLSTVTVPADGENNSTILTGPSQTEQTAAVPNASDVPVEVLKEKVFNICYGKQSKKKHKTWEGDGTLVVGEKTLSAKDEDGKVIGKFALVPFYPHSMDWRLQIMSRSFLTAVFCIKPPRE